VLTLLPAIPELAIRSTIADPHICIIATSSGATYALYVVLKFLVRHLLPLLLVFLCLLR
jgi:hypothetical protein